MQPPTTNLLLKNCSRRRFLAAIAVLGGIGYPASVSLLGLAVADDVAHWVAGSALKQQDQLHTRTQRLLDATQVEIENQIQPSLAPLQRVFAEAYSGVPEFVDHALGWTSKFKLAWDLLPGTANVRQQSYLREQFERLVLSEADLQRGVEGVVSGFAQEINSAESNMLVQLQLDMEGTDDEAPLGSMDYQAFRQSYRDALEQSQRSMEVSASQEVARLVIAVLVEKMISRMLSRCVTGGIILAGGGVTAPMTFGVSIGVAIVVDQLVSWVWSWFSDPRGDLELQLKQKLDAMQQAMIMGPDGEGGLLDELKNLARERAKLRQTAVMAIIGG